MTQDENKNNKAYLIILDGYGMGKHDKGDALFHAKTPFFDMLLSQNPYALLKTDGECVGLPSFQTGGSEVGHITIGSGRAVKHLLTKINDQIDTGDFFENSKLKKLFTSAQKKSCIHFIGMLSDGGIHSFQPHLYGLLKMAKQYEIQDIRLHIFADGRDVAERSLALYLDELYENISLIFGLDGKNRVKIVSISGRYFAMDRDSNWDRISEATKGMIEEEGSSLSYNSVEDYIQKFYEGSSDSDYYLSPACFDNNKKIKKGEIVINFNYRTDRSRQISEKIVEVIGKEYYGVFGPYCDGAQEIFNFSEEGDSSVSHTLGSVLEENGKTQLRISETEKFNHVTFFLSGERKKEFVGEKRILVPSPKCKSYSEKPEMSAREQTIDLMSFLQLETPDCIIQNYANADLVGHSGDFEAAEKAAEVLDECLEKVIPFAQKKGYQVFVTADHGNADEMLLPNGEANAGHTKAFVPFIKVLPLRAFEKKDATKNTQQILRKMGTLQDIAPTLLAELKLDIPNEMTGENIFL